MGRGRRLSRALAFGSLLLGCLLVLAPAADAGPGDKRPLDNIVAVGIVGHGEAVALATPGLPSGGRLWRYRSFDTRDLPQPIDSAVLAASGTKLLIQPATGPGGVLDLTRQHRHNAPLQHVVPGDLAFGDGSAHAHRLPGQRFVSMRDGVAYIVDDVGRVQREYPAVEARHAAITSDGAVLYVRADGTMIVCGEAASSRSTCRDLPARVDAVHLVAARAFSPGPASAPRRFAVIGGTGGRVRVLDPEAGAPPGPLMDATDAALRACLALNGLEVPDDTIARMTSALLRESGDTWAADGRPVENWRFFRVEADAELYAPVLEFAQLERVFPATFGALPALAKGAKPRTGQPVVDWLFERYLEIEEEARFAQCTFYIRTHSNPGSWTIEYWLYYPFDVGGLGSHPHDPEHIFVEVDKLGGTARRVIGAGHGYVAGNNVFTAENATTSVVALPLYAIVELGKHASAPDVDRDGLFTPGVDENEYEERAKIWGVRDAIGTINNQLLAYDTAMSTPRRPEHALALASLPSRFPGPDFMGRPVCRLERLAEPQQTQKPSFWRLSDWILLPPCHELTADCATRHVTMHPDFLDASTILKEWAFPTSFLRGTYGLGPGQAVHSIGAGYAVELDRLPGLGRILPLPGRIGIDGFYWARTVNVNPPNPKGTCPSKCERSDGAGWGLRYEQFLSNLFGVFSAARFYGPPVDDAWFTFGPLVEAPIGKRSNVSVLGGLSFGLYDPPQFELRISVGLWKPKTSQLGIRAASDHRR